MFLLRTLLLLSMLALSAAIAAGFLGALHPAFDTAAHFRAHLAVGLLALACLRAVMRRPIVAAPFAAIAIAAGVSCAPGLRTDVRSQVPTERADAPVYSLLQMNLLFNNPAPGLFLAEVDRLKPDIVTVEEVSQHWQEPLQRLHAAYPHRYRCPEWSAHGGVTIYSRFEITQEPTGCGGYGSLGVAHFLIDGRQIAIGAAHLRWPWPASGPRQIGELAPILAGIGPDALIVGDFNATTWSHSLQRFAQLGGLEVRGGVGPTWMWEGLPNTLARWIGFPIDNVLSKGAVRIVEASTLPPAGSDHLPVLVKFQLVPADGAAGG